MNDVFKSQFCSANGDSVLQIDIHSLMPSFWQRWQILRRQSWCLYNQIIQMCHGQQRHYSSLHIWSNADTLLHSARASSTVKVNKNTLNACPLAFSWKNLTWSLLQIHSTIWNAIYYWWAATNFFCSSATASLKLATCFQQSRDLDLLLLERSTSNKCQLNKLDHMCVCMCVCALLVACNHFILTFLDLSGKFLCTWSMSHVWAPD